MVLDFGTIIWIRFSDDLKCFLSAELISVIFVISVIVTFYFFFFLNSDLHISLVFLSSTVSIQLLVKSPSGFVVR